MNRNTASNVVKTVVCLLHEVLFVGIIGEGIPLQYECQTSMPQCFNNFGNCRLDTDVTEITMDLPLDMNKQAACYSNYKSRHTIKVLIGFALNAATVYCSKAYPGSTSHFALVQHNVLEKLFGHGDLRLTRFHYSFIASRNF